MRPSSKIPIILLVFSNETKKKQGGGKHERYLAALSAEKQAIKQAIDQANEKLEAPFCRLKILEGRRANIQEIYDTFNLNNGQIVVFHFAGHADGYQLLLQSADEEKTEVANAGGLVSFFRQQTSLKLIFLNGCETHQQAKELYDLGIPAVIGTNTPIGDTLAKDFAHRFYRSLAQGVSLEHAWNDALAIIQSKSIAKGSYRNRGIGATSIQLEQDQSWDLYTQSFDWNLGSEAQNPLFGLPPPPQGPWEELPTDPFRYLERYGKDDAEIFFGRGREIRQLFSLLVSRQDAPLILFHGQSGVGKSSVLEAGLFPRLQGRSPYQRNRIAMGRRDPKQGLLYTLKEALVQALVPFSGQAVSELRQNDLLMLIKQHLDGIQEVAVEAEAKENPFYKVPKLVIVLDQVEEVFTRPLEGDGMSIQREWTALLEILAQILLNPQYRYDVKVILSFRKEYHPEIKTYCQRFGLSWEDVFLRPLDEQGIREVVMGLQSTERLRKKYLVEMEESDAAGNSLPGSIAEDLMEDKYSPISPILQIQLSELWEKEKRKPDGRTFTYDKYKQLKRHGKGKLEQFFQQQMEKLWTQSKHLMPYVEAGLVLDLLHFHTTEMGTADQCRLQDLYDNYLGEGQEVTQAIQQTDLQALINELINLRLLLRLDDQSTRLAHDTLAPYVRKAFAYSELPGQRAAHILNNKVPFVPDNFDENAAQAIVPAAGTLSPVEKQPFGSRVSSFIHKVENLAAAKANDSNPLILDPANLRIIEAGKKGMRKWKEKEQWLIDFNRQIRKAQVRERQTSRMVLVGLFLVMGGLAFWGLRNLMGMDKKDRLLDAYVLSDRAGQELIEGSADSSLFFSSQAFLYNFPHKASHILKEMVVKPEEAGQAPGALIAIDTLEAPLEGVTLSPNGRYALRQGNGRAELFPLLAKGGRWKDASPHQDSVVAASFSPSGDRLCLLSNVKNGQGVARILDLDATDTLSILAQDTFTHELLSMEFYNDQAQILLGTADSVMIIWHYQKKQVLEVLSLSGATGVESVMINPNGQAIAASVKMSGEFSTLHFYWRYLDGQWQSEQISRTIEDFSPSGKLALENFVESVYLYDFSLKKSKQKISTIQLPGRYIWASKFDAEDNLLVRTNRRLWVFDQSGKPKDLFEFADNLQLFQVGSEARELYFLNKQGVVLKATEGKSPMRWIEEQSFMPGESVTQPLPPTLSLSEALPTFYTKMIAYTNWLGWLILLALLNLLAHFYFSYAELKFLITKIFGFLRPGLRMTLVTAFLYCVLTYLFRFKISDDSLGMLVFFGGLAFVFNLLQLFISYRSERYLTFYIWLALVLIWIVALGRFTFNIDSYGIFEYAYDQALIDWPLSALASLLGIILLVHVVAFLHKRIFGLDYENWLREIMAIKQS